MCCYYCKARAWTYLGEDQSMNEFLYTNFGPDAAHRHTYPRWNYSIYFTTPSWKCQLELKEIGKSIFLFLPPITDFGPWLWAPGWWLRMSGWISAPIAHLSAQFLGGLPGDSWVLATNCILKVCFTSSDPHGDTLFWHCFWHTIDLESRNILYFEKSKSTKSTKNK